MDAAFKEKIKKICTAAVAAPSGDNSQPWRFVFRAPNILEFHAIPEKDNVLLNVDDSGTLTALGAAIQNAELEAKSLGLSSEIRYNKEGTLVATFIFHKGGGGLSKTERDLQQAITLRHSNRKPYKKIPLTEDDRKFLLDTAEGSTGVSFVIIEGEKPMTLISRELTTMEEIALQNKSIHRLFFQSIFWSKARNSEGKSGLYIKTLELPLPAQLLFKILRYWSVASFFSRISFPKMVAETNAKQNASASAFGVITINRFNRMGYLEAGRLLERVWLATTARGMSLQIVTGLLFLARAMEHETSSIFSAAERASVRKAYARIRENLKGTDEPFLMFRVGYAAAPSAVSFRREPIIEDLH